MTSLENQFHRAMISVYKNAKKHDYFATYFKRLLDEYQGIETAKRLLSKPEIQEGLIKLWDMKSLDQSMEALVIQGRFTPLFTADVISEARRRLESLDYFK